MNRHFLSHTAAVLLLAAMLFACLCPAAAADESPAEDILDYRELRSVRLYVDGLLTGRAYAAENCIYLPFEALCGFFGKEPEIRRDDATHTVNLAFPGLDAVIPLGADYMCANSRYIFTPVHHAIIRDRLYLPVETVSALLGLECELSEDCSRVTISSDSFSPIRGGEDYYESSYSSADIFWLSRIIQAEAAGQCMAGKIGVANVVMNRLNNPSFPDTVMEVIFDTKYCIQFEPISNGSVFLDPSEESLIAAYLALDGCNTVGDAEYFVDPEMGNDTWFKRDLELVKTIQDHDFYREKGKAA